LFYIAKYAYARQFSGFAMAISKPQINKPYKSLLCKDHLAWHGISLVMTTEILALHKILAKALPKAVKERHWVVNIRTVRQQFPLK
jgi:hypothetical protein